MEYSFRKAEEKDKAEIWNILNSAIQRRKDDNSTQWQDGYPNPSVIASDIEKGAGYVLTDNNIVIGYCAIFLNDEPEYANIKGEWITNEDFIAFHRVAISDNYLGKGIAQKIMYHIEQVALSKNVYSVRADTNFDNYAMLRIFEKLGYIYCGEVSFRGSSRKAFEKVLPNNLS